MITEITLAQSLKIARTMAAKTLGVEIECYVPRETRQQLDAELAAALPYRTENWNTTTRSYWKGITDCTLNNPPAGYMGAEFVAPPLLPSQMFCQLHVVLTLLNKYKAKVNKTCGLHVHTDAAGFTPKRLQYVLNHMVKSEAALDCLIQPSRRNGAPDTHGSHPKKWCASNKELLDESINTVNGEVRTGQRYRYRNLNLTAFPKHGTIEYRQHGGSVDFSKIVAHLVICQATTERCRLKVPRTAEYQNPMHNVLIALKLATANVDGTLQEVEPAHRYIIRFVIERMTEFGFEDRAPILSATELGANVWPADPA